MSSEIHRNPNGTFMKGNPPGPGRRGMKRTLRADCYARLTEEERQDLINKQFEAARDNPRHGLEFLKWLEGQSPRDSKHDQPDLEGEAIVYVDSGTARAILEARNRRFSQRGSALASNSREQGKVDDAMAPGGSKCQANGHSNGRTQSPDRDDAASPWEE